MAKMTKAKRERLQVEVNELRLAGKNGDQMLISVNTAMAQWKWDKRLRRSARRMLMAGGV